MFNIGDKVLHPTLGRGIVIDMTALDYTIQLADGSKVEADRKTNEWIIDNDENRLKLRPDEIVDFRLRLSPANTLRNISFCLFAIFIIVGIVALAVLGTNDKLGDLGILYGLIALFACLFWAFICYIIKCYCDMYINKMHVIFDMSRKVGNIFDAIAKDSVYTNITGAMEKVAMSASNDDITKTTKAEGSPTSMLEDNNQNELTDQTLIRQDDKSNESSPADKHEYSRLRTLINALNEKEYTSVANLCKKCQIDQSVKTSLVLQTDKLKIYNALNEENNRIILNNLCREVLNTTIEVKLITDY